MDAQQVVDGCLVGEYNPTLRCPYKFQCQDIIRAENVYCYVYENCSGITVYNDHMLTVESRGDCYIAIGLPSNNREQILQTTINIISRGTKHSLISEQTNDALYT